MPDSDSSNDSRLPAVPVDRRAWIRQWVHREGSVTVDQLATDLGVSRMTVHRDLDALAAEGVVRKVRGGATASRSSLLESDWPYRKGSAVAAKRAIAAKAADFVESGMAVLLDESTTALTALEAVGPRESITVITNCFPTMTYITSHTSHQLIGLGGDYVPRYQAFLGLVSEQAIRGLYADVLLASCSAIRGVELFHQDQQIVGSKRAMLAAAPTRLLLVDSTKINIGALYHLGHVTEFTHVITDDRADPTFVESVREQGVEVIIAPVDEASA